MSLPEQSDSYDISDFTLDFRKEFASALEKGSVSFLSVVRIDLLSSMIMQSNEFFQGFGLHAAAYYKKYPHLQQIKTEFFRSTASLVANGRPELIPQLAKGITNDDDFIVFRDLLKKYQDILEKVQYRHKLLTYPGSFDPMHYGHRAMIAGLLYEHELDPEMYLAVNVNSYQARKPHLESTYERRFANLEYCLLRSVMLDPYKVCAIDFRFGAKEGEDHLRQTRLQSYMAGDSKLRWVIGGDKFLSEVERKRQEETQGVIGRTLSRFYLGNMAIYIVPRKGQDKQRLKTLVAELNNIYPAEFIYVEEKDYEGSPISSTLIRTYREEDSPDLKIEAIRMESSDLTREYHA